MSSHFVDASGLSSAWLQAAGAVASAPQRHLTHFVVRIESPLREDVRVRRSVDRLLASLRLQRVDTVANTIFPARWAIDVPDPSELASEYRDHYSVIKKLAGSSLGTYFGRIVSYPRARGQIGDQLNDTIDKLRKSDARGKPRWTSTYEMNIYNEESDRHVKRGFPCMSHLAFHLDGEVLHSCAQYRNQDIVEKAYGNYLGLAQLQRYVALAAGLEPGVLTILAGRAYVPSGKRRALDSFLARSH